MVKLFGFLDNRKNTKDGLSLLRDMFNSFEFGKSDYVVFEKFGLGHIKIPSMNRTGILEDKDFIVCFTGEIFDYKNINSKIKFEEEFILRSYKNSGTEFIQNLNGTFVSIIYEKKSGKLLIVNDRHGMKPIYYHANRDKIVFGSEIKAIIQDNRIERKINWDFWSNFFSYNHTLRNDTPFIGIYSLPNASILEYSKGKTKIRKYWDYDKIKVNYERTEEETVQHGVQIIKNIIQRQTKDVKECNLLLSGGYDSRCIAAAIKKYTNVKINAYTIPKDNAGKETYKDNDVKYAKLVSKNLKINHKIIPAEKQFYEKYFIKFIKQQEGMGFENMWMMPLIKSLNTKYKNFDGLAGDVFLRAGYLSKPSFSYSKDITNRKMLKKLSDKELTSLFDYYLKKRSLINPDSILPYFDLKIRKKASPDLKSLRKLAKNIIKQENGIKIFQAKYRTRNLICMQPNNLIIRRVYSRTPFLDNEFVEFAFSIPPNMKIKRDIYRQILEKSFPELMKISTTNQSRGFKSLFKEFLIKNDLKVIRYAIGAICDILRIFHRKNESHNTLSDNPHDIRYLIKLAKITKMPQFIDKQLLLMNIESHVKNDKDPTYFLEPIMHFCVWHKEFMK
jgi:asparagine synthase (glutamine-hydrolysing)